MEKQKQETAAAPARVVFLDRDGTMNEEVHYLYRPEDLRLIPGTAEAVRLLNGAGYRVIVVTNQAGVARGYYGEEEVRRLHAYLNGVLGREGAHVDAFYYCPHHPQYGIGPYKKECRCRKPGTGMLEAAERDLPGGIDRAASFLIGDKLADVEAGKRFGVTGILVGTGYGETERRAAETLSGAGALPYDYYAPDLLEAAKAILDGRAGQKAGGNGSGREPRK